MEKLVKPSEYAKQLGISRQAVYAKIKKGLLRTKSVEGQIYIIAETTRSKTNTQKGTPASTIQDHKALLAAKDETIAVLKRTIEDLKHSNEQIATTLKSEIELLKEAFGEMRALYAQRALEYEPAPILEADVETPYEPKWQKFGKWHKQSIFAHIPKDRLKKAIKRAYKQGDGRIKKENGKLYVDADANWSDLPVSHER